MTELYLQNSSVEAAALQEETILFDSKQNKFCMLNRTASFIWACLRVRPPPSKSRPDFVPNLKAFPMCKRLKMLRQF